LYDKEIKDRLEKVNKEFTNDSTPSKRRSVLVSFDNAVTAIDLTSEHVETDGEGSDGVYLAFHF
jgi:hypothetical protein